jgi:hypothetical protein
VTSFSGEPTKTSSKYCLQHSPFERIHSKSLVPDHVILTLPSLRAAFTNEEAKARLAPCADAPVWRPALAEVAAALCGPVSARSLFALVATAQPFSPSPETQRTKPTGARGRITLELKKLSFLTRCRSIAGTDLRSTMRS